MSLAADVQREFLAVSRKLLDVLGDEGLGSEWDQRDLAVDGMEPRWVALPETEEQCAAILRVASEHGLGVFPAGRGARLGIGRRPSRVDLVLSLERLSDVVDHAVADSTLTVRAGATLAALDETLRPAGQRLPFDPPLPERTTIGGLLAANAAGPSRQRFGTVRESLLGLRAILADGTAVKSGGRVVKNVAGYDVHRLLVGSFGTLAVIVEASFKLVPRPEVERTLAFTAPSPATLFAAASSLARSSLGPEALEVVRDPEGAHRLDVVLAGFAEEVEEAARRALAIAKLEETGPAAAAEPATVGPADAVLRLGLPPASLGAAFERACVRAAGIAERVSARAHAGVGVARIRLEKTSLTDLAALVGDFRREAVAGGGYLVVECLPPEWKRTIDVWGKPASGIEIMRGVKRAFDPRGVLAPGRFVEGV